MSGPEKNFENRIKKYLASKGCWVLKTFSNGVQRAGVPDLLICHKGKFIGVEVKAPNGRPTELQLWNIKEIQKAGGIAMVLYPKDFEDFKRLIERIESDSNE